VGACGCRVNGGLPVREDRVSVTVLSVPVCRPVGVLVGMLVDVLVGVFAVVPVAAIVDNAASTFEL
jgi:hypothetical protein